MVAYVTFAARACSSSFTLLATNDSRASIARKAVSQRGCFGVGRLVRTQPTTGVTRLMLCSGHLSVPHSIQLTRPYGHCIRSTIADAPDAPSYALSFHQAGHACPFTWVSFYESSQATSNEDAWKTNMNVPVAHVHSHVR